MNVLILSCGTRNKVVQYFKKALAGKGIVVATDMSPYAPALYDADKYYIVPKMTAPEYLDAIYGGLISLERSYTEQMIGVLE